MVVTSEPVAGFSGFAWLGPIVGPLGTAGLVLAMVIFMLLERRDLRDRLIGLFGHGQLTVTTKAFDEAGTRVSRQLLMQSLVNLLYGIAAGLGLYFLGVPYPLVWAALGAALRFIPYVGPVIGAGAPILVSLAALPGWAGPLWVMGLFVVLELFTNLVLETVLYAGAAGVSQVALLVSVAFWTWLWGPLGLLMATPLTVCLVVLGKHVPGLEFVGMLMADTPALAPEYGYYQRLLARDQSEAADLIDGTSRPRPRARSTTPCCCRRSIMRSAIASSSGCRRTKRRRSSMRRASCCPTRRSRSGGSQPRAAAAPMILAASGTARAAARAGLRDQRGRRRTGARRCSRHVLDDLPIVVEITGTRMLASELVSLVQSAEGLGRLPRRSAAQPSVEDALSRQEASRRVAGGANPGRAMGTAGAGGRQHADCCGMPARISWPRRLRRPGRTWAGSSRFRVVPLAMTAGVQAA